MKKKLLVVGSNSIHVHNFIHLVEDYFDEVLLVTNEINTKEDTKAINMDFSLGIGSLKTVRKLKKLLQDFQPSVIHVQQANTYAFHTVLTARGLQIPIVLTAWGSDILVSPQKSFLLKKMVQYVLRKVEVVTADSNHVLNSAQKLVDKQLSLHNVNFGIEIGTCKSEMKEDIVYSNRLHKKLYNIDKVIHSFAQFIQLEKNTHWKLVVAGSGEETEMLKAQVSKLGIEQNVDFVGFVSQEENRDYYCRSKVYISIPKSDSISISLVEAIIYGCVPFVSNLEANLELIEDGRNGFVEDDLSEIGFSKYMQIDEHVFEKTREEVKTAFSKVENKKRYFSIYDEVIKS